MKRIWGWLSERLFASEPVKPVRHVIAIETPSAAWSLTEVNELRWA